MYLHSNKLQNGDIITFDDGFMVLVNDLSGVGDGYYTVLVTELKGGNAGIEAEYPVVKDVVSRYIEQHGEIKTIKNILSFI